MSNPLNTYSITPRIVRAGSRTYVTVRALI